MAYNPQRSLNMNLTGTNPSPASNYPSPNMNLTGTHVVGGVGYAPRQQSPNINLTSSIR